MGTVRAVGTVGCHYQTRTVWVGKNCVGLLNYLCLKVRADLTFRFFSIQELRGVLVQSWQILWAFLVHVLSLPRFSSL